jgi:hypothetical protein
MKFQAALLRVRRIIPATIPTKKNPAIWMNCSWQQKTMENLEGKTDCELAASPTHTICLRSFTQWLL